MKIKFHKIVLRAAILMCVAYLSFLSAQTTDKIYTGDNPNNHIDPNTTSSPYAGVGGVEVDTDFGAFTCTGSLIASNVVITAAHCFDLDDDGDSDVPPQNVKFILNYGRDRSHVLSVQSVHIHPEYEGFGFFNFYDDIAILRLSTPAPSGAPVYKLKQNPVATGTRITFVGYGEYGFGANGIPLGGGDETTKRVAENVIDNIISDPFDGPAIQTRFAYDFDDSPGDGLGFAIEGTIGNGDSGGPSFEEIGGELFLVGVNTYGDEPETFGGISGGMLVHGYLPFIQAFLPPVVVPTALSASDNEFTDRIRLEWTSPANIDEVEIWRSSMPDVTTATLVGTFSAGIETTDDLFPVGGNQGIYYYWARSLLNGRYSFFTAAEAGGNFGVGPAMASTFGADSDRNGIADLLLQRSDTGDAAIWMMSDANTVAYGDFLNTQVNTNAWKVAAFADCNGDQWADIVWQNTISGTIAIWEMVGGRFVDGYAFDTQTGTAIWEVACAADFDGDNIADLVLQHKTTGQAAVWFQDSGGLTDAEFFGDQVGASAAWKILTAADMNGDGDTDLVWGNIVNGVNAVWLMDGLGLDTPETISVSLSSIWRIVGTTDANADTSADLILQNTINGKVVSWEMDGGSVLAGSVIAEGLPAVWQVRNSRAMSR